MTSGGPRPLPLAAAKPSLGEAASGPLAPSPLAGWPPGTLATPPPLRLRPAGRWARGPGPARRSRFRPSATRPAGVPGRPDLRQWRPCSYRDPARPGGGPLAGGSASFSEPCLPRQPPRAPERPCTARRRRLRLSTAASSKQASGAACRGSGRVARAAVPSARESRSRLFSVEKTGNFARLRQAAQDTPRLTGRRHPLSRRKWKQLPIFACRRCTMACLPWPAGTANQLHYIFSHRVVSETDSPGLRRREARPG